MTLNEICDELERELDEQCMWMREPLDEVDETIMSAEEHAIDGFARSDDDR